MVNISRRRRTARETHEKGGMTMKQSVPFAVLTTVAFLLAGLAAACSDGSDNTVTDGDTDGDTEVTETHETNPNLEEGACEVDADCDTYSRCKKHNTEVDGCVCLEQVCVPKPLKEAQLYYENSVYDAEEREKTGSFDPVAGGSVDVSCVDATYTAVSGDTPKTNILGYIKVFGLEGPCNLLDVHVYLQFDSNGDLTDFTDENNIVATGDNPGEPDDITGDCPVFIPDVPTDKWLVVKTGDENLTFKDTYKYNIFIRH